MDVYCVQWENVWFRMILPYNMCPTATVYTETAWKSPSLIPRPARLHALKATGRQSPSPGKSKGQQHHVWDTCNVKLGSEERAEWQRKLEDGSGQCCLLGKMGQKWYQLAAGPVILGWEAHLCLRDTFFPHPMFYQASFCFICVWWAGFCTDAHPWLQICLSAAERGY